MRNTLENSENVFVNKELTEKVIKCAFEVHNILGSGFLEKVYEKS